MIPEAHIRGWRENAPWTDDAMVEQDLLICRALAAIFSDDFLSEQLAFRGGTALHKLYLHPQSRYSEDIDLVQVHPGPIKPIIYKLGEVLSYMPDKVVSQRTTDRQAARRSMAIRMIYLSISQKCNNRKNPK